MKKSEFDSFAQAAVQESQLARKTLSKAQADRFLKNSTEFDPVELLKLGDEGMATFLNVISRGGIEISGQPLSSTSPKVEKEMETYSASVGWRDLRQPEPSWTLFALGCGVLTGIVPLGIGAIYFYVNKI